MPKQGFEARELTAGDREGLDRLAKECGCLFDTSSWTGMFGGSRTLGMYDAGGALRGGVCLCCESKAGLTVLRDPPFTPSVGPFFECRAKGPVALLEERRDVLTALAEYLEEMHPAVTSLSLARWVTDCLPFYWRNYKVVPHYTYLLALGQTEESLLSAMSVGRRNDIQKALKDGLKAELTSDYSAIAKLVEVTFARQGRQADREHVNRILFSFARPDNSYAHAVRAGDAPIAGVFVVHDARTAYYLLGGYDSERKHHGAGALAVFEAIRHARQLGLSTFDFEGSMVPAIERYFRGFGGKLTPYYRVSKAWLPLEMALKLVKRQLF